MELVNALYHDDFLVVETDSTESYSSDRFANDVMNYAKDLDLDLIIYDNKERSSTTTTKSNEPKVQINNDEKDDPFNLTRELIMGTIERDADNIDLHESASSYFKFTTKFKQDVSFLKIFKAIDEKINNSSIYKLALQRKLMNIDEPIIRDIVINNTDLFEFNSDRYPYVDNNGLISSLKFSISLSLIHI